MTPTQLIALAEAIYGPERGDNWKTTIAKDLGISVRSLQRYIYGKRPIPDGIEEDLLAIAHKRAKALAATAAARAKELKAIAEGKS